MSPHGTTSRYTNDRCRCKACKHAWRDAHWAYMQSHPEQKEKHRQRARAQHARARARRAS